MRAGTITLRIADRLVGMRADTPTTLGRLRTLVARWNDDDIDAPWMFDVVLDSRTPSADSTDRGPIAVPQLRFGQRTVARSREPDDVLVALVSMLGGVHAQRSEPHRTWLGMRVFVRGESAVLLDAAAPMLLGDRTLARSGVREVASWAVALGDGGIDVPTPLSGVDWAGAGLVIPRENRASYRIAGVVGGTDSRDDAPSSGSLLARYGARHTAAEWFATVATLVETGRVITVDARPGALRHAIESLLER